MMQRCMRGEAAGKSLRCQRSVMMCLKELLALSRVWLKEAKTPESNLGVETWHNSGII